MSFNNIATTIVLKNSELTKKIFRNNTSFLEQANLCKAFPFIYGDFQPEGTNRESYFPLHDYTFTIIVKDSNTSKQCDFDGASRLVFLNEESMQKEIAYFKKLKKKSCLMQDIISFCIEDRRPYQEADDNPEHGARIAAFIDQLFEIFDNATTLNLKTYNRDYYSSLTLYAIDKMVSPKINKITNLNFSRLNDFFQDTNLDNKVMFSNFPSLKEVGLTAFKNEEVDALITMNLMIRLANFMRNFCLNIYNISFKKHYEYLHIIFYNAFKKNLLLKIQYNRYAFNTLLMGYCAHESVFTPTIFLLVTEVKVNFNELNKLDWLLRYGKHLKSLIIYLDSNVVNSYFVEILDGIPYREISLKYPLLDLSSTESLTEVGIISNLSISDNQIFKPLTKSYTFMVNYILEKLPKGVKRLTLSGDDFLCKNTVCHINNRFPMLETLVIRKMIIKGSLDLTKFDNIRFLYLSYVNKVQILKKLDLVMIEHGGEYEMEKPTKLLPEWINVETRWTNDKDMLGENYHYFYLTVTYDRFIQIYTKNFARTPFCFYVLNRHKEHIQSMQE